MKKFKLGFYLGAFLIGSVVTPHAKAGCRDNLWEAKKYYREDRSLANLWDVKHGFEQEEEDHEAEMEEREARERDDEE